MYFISDFASVKWITLELFIMNTNSVMVGVNLKSI